MSAVGCRCSDQNGNLISWEIKYDSIETKILEPLGLYCNYGGFINGVKTYVVQVIKNQHSIYSHKLTSDQFSKLLKVKSNNFNFEGWVERLNRKEKLEYIEKMYK